MASVRQIKRRIRSVQNTSKITKAMSMIAASKMRRTQEAAMQGRPYSKSIMQLMADIISQMSEDDYSHPLLEIREEKVANLIILSPDRGLTGGLNSNINRVVAEFIRDKKKNKVEINTITIGKKGRDFINSLNEEMPQGIYQSFKNTQETKLTRQKPSQSVKEFLKAYYISPILVRSIFERALNYLISINEFELALKLVAKLKTIKPEYDFEKRSPYASLQTSLGCVFKCDFCMINLINRNDSEEIGVASKYSNMRFWSTNFIIKEFDKLIKMGVRTIRIIDEMFLLNPKYYVPLCEKLAERNKDDKLRMWSYSRIDTVKRPETLRLVRKAGIKWLCLGIESGDKSVRLEVAKGKFDDVDVRDVIKKVHEADINVMANYIYGLPGDNKKTIKKTFDLSLELCTAGWNTYAAMALPGSQLYKNALEKKYKLPSSYEGYSFHSYETQPLPTQALTAEEILEYRDKSFKNYHTYKPFLEKIEKKFGKKAIDNIKDMTKVDLKRKILGHSL